MESKRKKKKTYGLLSKVDDGVGESGKQVRSGVVQHSSSDRNVLSVNDVITILDVWKAVASYWDEGEVGGSVVLQYLPETYDESRIHGVNGNVLVAQSLVNY
jgi:hypothetical protein